MGEKVIEAAKKCKVLKLLKLNKAEIKHKVLLEKTENLLKYENY